MTSAILFVKGWKEVFAHLRIKEKAGDDEYSDEAKEDKRLTEGEAEEGFFEEPFHGSGERTVLVDLAFFRVKEERAEDGDGGQGDEEGCGHRDDGGGGDGGEESAFDAI